jgi:glycosyltransferase involved in cell wall biosynthesis
VNRCLASRQDATTKRQEFQESTVEDVKEGKVFEGLDKSWLHGKRMVAVSFSAFPGDPRPRRAAEAFCNAGMKVQVICLSEEGSPSRETFNGIEIERIPLRHNRGSKSSYILRYCLFIALVFTKLAMRSLTKRYDVVHIHNMPDVLVFTALIPKLRGANVLLDLHDPMPELMMTIFDLKKESMAVKFMTVLEKWSIAFADAVLTVNLACEKLFSSRSCAGSKITVVMNSPDENIFPYVPAQIGDSDGHDRPFVIMYHGTLVERNGVDLAVEAVIQLRRSIPAAELRIYGPRTPFLEQVMSTVTEKGMEKAVHYLGPRRLEGLVEAIKECDVGVIPNKRSIFTEINTPTRIFEYLALGKPVVAPSAAGIQDYFSDKELVLFELGNADDLARKLEWVATHPVEAFEITRGGQAVYRSHCWHSEEAKLIDVARDLLVHKR